ncbi:glycosyltransferase [Candidatus Mycobacterium wuenschmannii]|uniref:Glycosyltransferase n=1 Tax=Candidatus Mycobacterium wuenschmannii TaxID=3027808 RepID=A0ABY8W8I7_9MYCO|nr:glycosyltransferase [Candidatus Mycobacterium wuenschmannii]WIM90084.1 glycosyltransferase [Candidatus Mycobacterium wuenschmannii]
MLRIASVPASHVYVQHLSDPAARTRVVRLADPIPADRRIVPGGWWPPLMLDPTWIAAHHREFDVFHVHFGFDTLTSDAMAAALRELRRVGKPLVYTAHDLRNPRQRDATSQHAHLDMLMAAANAVITLTPGAADSICARWDRKPAVLPHPHVVQRCLIERRRTRREQFVVGVHVKSLRANMDPFPVLDTLADTVAKLPDAELVINVHDEIFEPDSHFYAPVDGAALRAYGKRNAVRVVVHPYFSEAQLWSYLSGLTVSVLPYRFGTHSGWLEACYDLGTAVVAPRCGFYHEQKPCETFELSETTFDPQSLRSAVNRLYNQHKDRRPPSRATWPQRRHERVALAAAHRDIYNAVKRGRAGSV